MTTITSTIRVQAWNIVICDYPPGYRFLAGAFQSIDEPFLTWKDLFHDLLLCFDLEPYITAPDSRLALYLVNGNDVLVDKPGTPFIYYSGPEEQLSKYITLKPEGPDLPTTHLIVCLICHNTADCKEAKAELEHHLQSGCARKIILERNCKFVFLPIPGSHSELATPNVPTTASPAKRPRSSGSGPSIPASNPFSQSSTPIGSTPRTSTPRISTPRTSSPPTKLTVRPEPELEIKQFYKGKCVITGFDTAWSSLVAGPGIETCHIVPKAMYAWYGYPDIKMSTQQKWNMVNSSLNCITMESLSHTIHDNRLLAIHPISHKIRLFAPIKPLEGRNNKPANISFPAMVDEYALKWHYQQTVVENMCALFLQYAGGAKRFPWRGGPNSIMTTNEEEQPEVGGGPRAILPARTRRPTDKGTSAAGRGDGDVLGDTGPDASTCCELGDESPLQTISEKNLRHMSADFETYDHDEFAAELYDQLEEESIYQEGLDHFNAWTMGANGLMGF